MTIVWKDMNLERRTLQVTQAKTNKEGEWVLGTTKRFLRNDKLC